MAKYRVLFCRFPNRWENPDAVDWLIKTMFRAKSDPRVEVAMSWFKADTPITMTRNMAVEVAKTHKADFVVMLDDDMYPDMYLDRDPNAKPFWDVAFNFLIKHNGPGMIAVPYCGPPPIENVYIFRWASNQSNHPNVDLKIDQYSREEAATRSGIEEVAALPTGLCMFHLSAIERLKPPYFYYEWKDPRAMEKASTEDVTFTRDLAFAGVPIYCAWDCWAGHWKWKCVGKPGIIGVKDVGAQFQRAALRHVREEFERLGKCVCGHADKMGSPLSGMAEPITKDLLLAQTQEAKEETKSVIAAARPIEVASPWHLDNTLAGAQQKAII